MAGFRPLAIRR